MNTRNKVGVLIASRDDPFRSKFAIIWEIFYVGVLMVPQKYLLTLWHRLKMILR